MRGNKHLERSRMHAEELHVSELNRPSFVVGIGASAGGLESLETLFQNLPADTGMAFVIIQHLSPDFKSMMYELLARDTKMEIHRVEDGMVVEANHVYLLPPKKEIIMAGGELHLIDKDVSKGLALPIDRFFESLARECGSRAVGIILSGSGSDGSRGIRDLAQAGGLVICESEETAKFDGMPLSAQSTGLVDIVLAPRDMGKALLRHAENPTGYKKDCAMAYKTEQARLGLRGADAIYELFRHEYDLDFSAYKEATVLRRIGRRLAMSDSLSIDSYAERLSRDKAELNSLFQDLLIGVTQFFRDEEAFEYLKESILPELLAKRAPDRTIRVWVSACATGEEAYSLAILFHEAMEAAGRPLRLKIFATDVHKKSLVQAGRGVFGEDSMKYVSEERRKRYFVQHEDCYQISNDIRELVVFAPHNLLRDAPFTDLDFVSCRNLLIYFQPAAQSKALSLFHFGLNSDGILFLGSSESPGELADEFETLHERNKVFRKLRQVRLPAKMSLPEVRGTGQHVPVAAIRGFNISSRGSDAGLLRIYDQLLNRYMPPSLLINEKRELVDSFGGAEKLLHLPARRPTLDVLDLVDPAIRTTLLGALQQSGKNDSQVRFSGVKISGESDEQSFILTVEPFRNPSTLSSQFLVTFEPTSPVVTKVKQSLDVVPNREEITSTQITQLEDELRYAKENLQATIEELETSNEELQATNEELVASNEELQSTNEELHSVNEELYSVNAEHQRKISELAEVNHDMHHLLENTDVATIFLDGDLKIRKFTSHVRKIFDLIDQDIGRPISSFAHRIQLDNMLDRIKEVRERGDYFESEVYTVDGVCYLLRILPHRVREEIDGIVIVMVDLSPLEDLRGRLRWMSSIVASTDDAIIGEDLQGYITSWNRGAVNLYGYSAEEAIGKHVSFLIPNYRQEEVAEYLAHIQRGESVRTLQTIRLHRDGRAIHVSLTISAVRDALGRVIGISKIARDVTERVEVESKLRDQAKQRDMFLAMLSHELRNPLSAVLTASHLLTDHRTEEDGRTNAIATIQRQSAMIASLLDDLLDVSRISLGKIELELQAFNLVELVESIRETILPEIVSHQSKLQFEIREPELYVEADWDRLVQVHVNLIHNAAKYSPPQSPIFVTMFAEDGSAVVTVRDEGSGISADFLPRIFEPFVQSDDTLDRSEGGLGVGLTLVKSIVELHGGTIEAFSEGRGSGSTFVIRLPLSQKRPAPNPQRSEEGASCDRIDSLKPGADSTVRVVLVEDIDDNREMLQALLELDGHQVISAKDGEAGCEAILKHRPKVALIDIGLPGIDGYEVARRVRRDAACREIRLIALTGYGQKSDIAAALDAGFDEHLVKPVDPEALAVAMHSNAKN